MGFGQFLTILRARSGVMVFIVLAALATGAVVTLMWPKRYEATASVILDPKGEGSIWGTNASPPPAADNLVTTHLDLIASPTVALKVVAALNLEKEPRARALLTNAGPLRNVQAWLASLVDGAPQEPADSKDWMADRLLHNLKLSANRESRVIRVTYASPDPRFAASVANAFVRAYRDTLLALRVQPAAQSAQWFEEQLKGLKSKLEESEAKLAKFQQQKGILTSDERVDVENARLVDLSAQLAAAQGQSYETRARQQQLRDYLGTGAGDAPPEVLASPVVQALKQGVTERQAKLGELAKRIGPNHPQYQAAVAELESLKSQLREASRTAAQSHLTGSGAAGEREGGLRAALDQQRAKVLQLKNARGELAMLARDVENAQRAYNAAVERFTQSKMESQVDQSSVSAMIDSARVPGKPVSPNARLNLAVALALGIALAIGLGLLLETLNRYVRSAADLSEVLGLPVLAVLGPRGRGRNVARLRGPDYPRLAR